MFIFDDLKSSVRLDEPLKQVVPHSRNQSQRIFSHVVSVCSDMLGFFSPKISFLKVRLNS